MAFGIVLGPAFNMRKYLLISLAFAISNVPLSAQSEKLQTGVSGLQEQTGKDSLRQGQVQILQDEELNKLIQLYNEAEKSLDGFRVQIFLGKPKEAQSIRSEFIAKHSDIPAYAIWQSPNMKVRVGNFRSRLDAERALLAIRKDYPGAYIVKDLIELPALLDIPNGN